MENIVQTIVIFSILLTIHTDVLNNKKKCTLSKIDSNDGIFKLIGFFPITNGFQSDLSTHAIAWSEAMRYEIKESNKLFNNTKMFGYTMYDTCSSHLDIVTEAMMEVLLDKGLEFSDGCICTYQNLPLFFTIGVVGPAISSNTRYVNELLSFEKLAVISYASTSPELGDKKKYPNFYRTTPPDTYQAIFLKDIFLQFDWMYVSVIASDDIYGRYGIQFLKREFTRTKICIGLEETFSVPLIHRELHLIMRKLKLDKMANVIILWGYFFAIKAILKIAQQHGIHNKTWIISEASGRNNWFMSEDNKLPGTFLIIVPDSGRDISFENYFLNLTYNESKENPWLQRFFHTHSVNKTHNTNLTLKDFPSLFDMGNRVGYVQKAVAIYIQAFLQYLADNGSCDVNWKCKIPPIVNHEMFNNLYITPATFKGKRNNTFSFNSDGQIAEAAFDLLLVTKKDWFQLVLHWASTGVLLVKNSSLAENLSKIHAHCSKPCLPGFYPVSSIRKCCWECILCGIDHIKSSENQTSCTECPYNHISNKQHTRCITLKLNRIGYHSTKAYVIYVLTSIGMIMTLPIIFTFIATRHTPVVRSSKLNSSLIQLSIHLLIFIIPYLFLGRDTKTKCICRAYCISTSFVLIIALSISKINHIVSVFNLKYRLTKWEIIKLRTTQLAIVFTCLLIKICLSIALFEFKPVLMKIYKDRLKAELNEKCDIEHYQYQVAYILILEIICGIQAFRGRKLPANYNEAKYVAFAMFTSTLITATGIPLTSSMPNINDQNLTIAIITILANMSILVILYGYKIRIIWFHSELNSVDVFQRERMEKVIIDTEKRLSTVTCISIGSISNRNNLFVQSVIRRQKQSNRKLGVTIQFNNTSFYDNEISADYTDIQENKTSLYDNEISADYTDIQENKTSLYDNEISADYTDIQENKTSLYDNEISADYTDIQENKTSLYDNEISADYTDIQENKTSLYDNEISADYTDIQENKTSLYDNEISADYTDIQENKTSLYDNEISADYTDIQENKTSLYDNEISADYTDIQENKTSLYDNEISADYTDIQENKTSLYDNEISADYTDIQENKTSLYDNEISADYTDIQENKTSLYDNEISADYTDIQENKTSLYDNEISADYTDIQENKTSLYDNEISADYTDIQENKTSLYDNEISADYTDIQENKTSLYDNEISADYTDIQENKTSLYDNEISADYTDIQENKTSLYDNEISADYTDIQENKTSLYDNEISADYTDIQENKTSFYDEEVEMSYNSPQEDYHPKEEELPPIIYKDNYVMCEI